MYNNRGIAYEKKRSTTVIADYTAAIRLQPDYATAYRHRRVHLLSETRVRPLHRRPHGSDRFSLDNADAYQLWRRPQGQGQYDRAIADYTAAIRLQPDHAEAYYNRGHAHGAKDEHDQAIADFTAAIRIQPDMADAYVDRGVAHGKRGEYDQAIADCTEAIRIKPDLAMAYYVRGDAHEEKGDQERAAADYAKAKELGMTGPSPKYQAAPEEPAASVLSIGKRYEYPTGNIEMATRVNRGEPLPAVLEDLKRKWTPGYEYLWDEYDAESLIDSDEKRQFMVNQLLYADRLIPGSSVPGTRHQRVGPVPVCVGSSRGGPRTRGEVPRGPRRRPAFPADGRSS